MSFKHTSWVYVDGVAIPKGDYNPESTHTHMIMPDIQEYHSTITGELITSRSKHKAHLRQHGCFEVGNEKLEQQKRPDMPAGLKEEIIRNMQRRT